MSDDRTDEIARAAARLIESGKADSIRDAVRRAVDALGHYEAPRPSSTAVRRHAQAIAMQAMGEESYRQSIVDVWRTAEEVMTALERYHPRLLGRAARGHIDAGVTLYLHVYTRDRIGEIAQWLVDYGYDEPVFETADTRFGRFDRIRIEESGLEIVVTRLLPETRRAAEVDLYTGRPAEFMDLEAIRARIESESGDDN